MIPDVGRRGQRYSHLADVFADEGFGGDGPTTVHLGYIKRRYMGKG